MAGFGCIRAVRADCRSQAHGTSLIHMATEGPQDPRPNPSTNRSLYCLQKYYHAAGWSQPRKTKSHPRGLPGILLSPACRWHRVSGPECSPLAGSSMRGALTPPVVHSRIRLLKRPSRPGFVPVVVATGCGPAPRLDIPIHTKRWEISSTCKGRRCRSPAERVAVTPSPTR